MRKLLFWGILLLLGVLGVCFRACAQQVVPARYWTFNRPDITLDSTGQGNLNFNAYNSLYTVNNECSGKSINFQTNTSLVTAPAVIPSTQLSVEFLMKPDMWHKRSAALVNLDPYMNISFSYAQIYFGTSHKVGTSTVNDDMVVLLEDINAKSYNYYKDGNFHHMVFKVDLISGKKEIYVDGRLCFSKTISPGTFTGMAPSGLGIYFNKTSDYDRYLGAIDDIAIYIVNLPPSLIYKHYLNFQSCKPYSYTDDFTGVIPSTPSFVGTLDTLDFATTPLQLPTDQLSKFPKPRYKPGHTMMRNFNWMDPDYMGGQFQSWSTSNLSVATYGGKLSFDLAKEWNYYLPVSWQNSLTDPRDTVLVGYANRNPDLPLSMITLRIQIPNCAIRSQTKSNANYLQNSSGSFLSTNGTTTTNKIWRPSAPVGDYNSDGNYVYGQLNLLSNLNRNIDIVNENAELFPLIENNALQLDPQVVADKNSTGLDWKKYLAKRVADNEKGSYRDILMTHPKLTGAKFTEYQISGFGGTNPPYGFEYSEARKINSQINGQYYSTSDFYPRWANNWRYWQTAWHGWQWFVEGRNYELALGDKYFSPFVSAGWDANESVNIRPAQWMGLLKSLTNLGAEFFYTGFFSLSAPYPDSRNWIWQAVIPSYVQATVSRYEELYKNSYLMNGDIPSSWTTPTVPGYSFDAKDPRKLVVVRKHNTLNKYIITGTIQPNSNYKENTVVESPATITLDGQQITFNVRRQGSVYIYDKSGISPVFYQVDGWHEASHPSRWSKDFVFEGELSDTTSAIGTQFFDTNYSNAVSYAKYNNDTLKYEFTTTSASTYYLFVRARSTDGVNGRFGVKVNNDTMRFVSCITDTNWVWYKYQVCSNPLTYNLSAGKHTLSLSIQNDKTLIDKAVLSLNPSLYSTAAQCTVSCSTICTTPTGLTNVAVAASIVNVSWTPSGAPYGYQVKLKNMLTGVITYYTIPVGVTTCTFNTTPGTTYRWWVRAKCTNTSYSAYSSFKKFTTPANMARLVSKNYTIEIFPNPAENYVNVRIRSTFQETLKINLFDYMGRYMQGKEIYHDKYSLTEVRLDNVDPGIYLVFVESDNIKYVEQLIILKD